MDVIRMIFIYAVPFLLIAAAAVCMKSPDKKVRGYGTAQLILSLPPFLLTLSSIAGSITGSYASRDSEIAGKITQLGYYSATALLTLGIGYYAVLAAAELILLFVSRSSGSTRGALFSAGFFLCAAVPFVILSLYPIFD